MSTRPPRPAWQEFRRALEAAGFRPSKKLGQNFLLDENTARAIVSDAGVEEDDHVLEVGPGCGFLSVHLAHAVRRLDCIEVDTRLAPVAARFLEPYPGAQVHVGDAMAGKHALGPAFLAAVPAEEPWHLVANLPYSISAPFLALVSGLENAPRTFTVLVQAELADRLAANTGSKDWGPLSVSVQSSYAVRPGRTVPPGAFTPRPRVDSRLAHGTLLEDRESREQRLGLRELAGKLMQRRRQTVGRVLGDLLGARAEAQELLERTGIEASLRVGEVDLPALRRLRDALP